MKLSKGEWKKRGTALREGVKVIGEWTDLGGGRGFLLIEAEDPKVLMAGTLAWSDLMEMQSVPVIQTEEVMKLAKTPGSVLPGVDLKL
ncbi:MAG: hypothetical protein A2157_15450 [Deltaproteobacteria bacterium RBG_16_47_11]|nr:MAG: hypothetical protein A2157_15450 [Deltaproteobacteria bacterium RBG_16_47_11]